MTQPRISVCIPTYNRARLLKECLTSIVRQTCRDIEILVSDNCSTDDTESVVRSFADPRIQYVRQAENIGPIPNINSIVARAQGAYIAVMHDDDVYLPRFLESEAAMLDAHPSVGMVHCAGVLTAGDRTPQRVMQVYPASGVRPWAAEFERYLEGHNVLCSTVMVRREMYDRVGLFEPKYLCNDFHMWLRLALHADVGYVAEPLVQIRQHPETVTSWLTPERWCSEHLAIVHEAMAMATAQHPDIFGDWTAARRRGAMAQGRRFFIASASETTKGRFAQARQFADVLQRFEGDGLPRYYRLVARLFANRAGQLLLKVVRRWWRASALAAVEDLPSSHQQEFVS